IRSIVSAPADSVQRSHPVPVLPYDHSDECPLHSLPAELQSQSTPAYSPPALLVVP
ncbi:hypothetical protein Tco_0515762, partial [Tanacetum coccineum]